jgi:sirohydrochlorin cobaltochelatase
MTDRLLIGAHGFVRDRDHAHPAREHAWRLRGTDAFDEVVAGFAHGDPTIESQVKSMQGGRLVVVPLFVSDGYFVNTVVPDRVESAQPTGLTVEYTDPVGTHERVTEVIRQRGLGALSQREEDAGLALVGHGSEHGAQNRETIQSHARRIRDTGPFGEVRSYFIEEEPTATRLPEESSTSQVVVVPVFVADGTHVREDIPEQIGVSGRHGTVDGTDITCVGPVGTDPLVAGIVHERALGTLDEGERTGATTGQSIAHQRRQTQ